MADKRPKCLYGNTCYRKDPNHHSQFQHPPKLDTMEGPPSKKTKFDSHIDSRIDRCHGFFLNKVEQQVGISGVEDITLRQLLSEENGQLLESIHFNFLYDYEWLIDQYPPDFRDRPIYIVYGFRGNVDNEKVQIEKHDQMVACPVKLLQLYGVHHTKMMILRYESGIRIVIHTANLISSDWESKTQGLWISQVLPPCSVKKELNHSNFKSDLTRYLAAYQNDQVNKWIELIKRHDFSDVKVFLIGSIPGAHQDNDRNAFGHLKLRQVLSGQHGPTSQQKFWDVICLFSSIGSLGPSPDKWLTGQFLASLSAFHSEEIEYQKGALKLIFPTVENVRFSLEGYPAGASIPYRKEVAKRQPYLQNMFHRWQAEISRRSEASPHIKAYLRFANSEISWFCLTSANLSKAAWGELQKSGRQLYIRSFELGVLFLPKLIIERDAFKVGKDFPINETFPVPFDLPPVPYAKDDKPWIIDEPHLTPDRNGNIWDPSVSVQSFF